MDLTSLAVGFVAGGAIMGIGVVVWILLEIVVTALLVTPGNVPAPPEPDPDAENQQLREENERLRRQLKEARDRLRELEGQEHSALDGVVKEALGEGH